MFHSLGQRRVRRRAHESDPRIDSERTPKRAHFDVPKKWNGNVAEAMHPSAPRSDHAMM